MITDILMSEKDGIEIIAWLHRNLPKTKVIAISGGGRYSLTEMLQVAHLMGAHRVFTKPVSPRELLVAIGSLFEKTAD